MLHKRLKARTCAPLTLLRSWYSTYSGTANAKELIKGFGSWAKFRKAVCETFSFYTLANFGVEMHRAIMTFDYSEADVLVEKIYQIH